MDDDLYTRYAKGPVDAAARKAFQIGLAVGQEQGFKDGVATGQMIGFAAGIQFCAPAVSDGLRKGSSECGRALQAFQNLGLGDQE